MQGPQGDGWFTCGDGRDERRGATDRRGTKAAFYAVAGYHRYVMTRNNPRPAIALLLAGLLGGCALLSDDRPTPARSSGPPERSFWFLERNEAPPEPTETIGGRVQVLNGDTVRVDDTLVYLAGIDAPEPEQLCRRASGLPYRCGEDMTALLEQRLQRDRVTCEVALLESGVYTGVCRHYGANLNEWMVRQGYAVANNVDSPYVDIEREAALAGRGLWAGIFERPSDWRERND